ncbi:uncharacterized protein LOC108202688 isoform X1 [Daucus carota subsp. sativus]|uniref:uncharacterized protein LOC108202688 isoform X1 n=1 Tax=Daucus carota subsp. sativus TaxID=79200 RepID=UPI0007EFB393|nr:PREDICTED: uncharacterized protein LOC108202688 [Daucus carota subsp. sativus]
MGRRQISSNLTRRCRLYFLTLSLISCSIVYLYLSFDEKGEKLGRNTKCCKGVEHMELWGNAVRWGANHKAGSAQECCKACKKMCGGEKGECLCDSWVYCGDKDACGNKFGECWLKKQKDSLDPDRRESGDQIMWTSGIIYGKGEGIVGLETSGYGIIYIKLLPECAPQSVSYILELLATHHCPGCHLYRAESRGSAWDLEGNHIQDAPFGPPFAMIQGTLEAHGTIFNKIPKELSYQINRGSVAWIGSGPEFFISLANHNEWKNEYSVFGFVLPEYMKVVEIISQLPTKQDLWHNINVSVLKKTVPIRFRRFSEDVAAQ